MQMDIENVSKETFEISKKVSLLNEKFWENWFVFLKIKLDLSFSLSQHKLHLKLLFNEIKTKFQKRTLVTSNIICSRKFI